MPNRSVIARKGERHELDATVGWSVMEIIRENNLPIEAACGGCSACATWHVYVDEAWLGRLEAANSDEAMMPGERSRFATIRGCPAGSSSAPPWTGSRSRW